VAIAEHMAEALRARTGLEIDVTHRDVGEVAREAAAQARAEAGDAPPPSSHFR
jgi:hypothetical protein